MPFDVIGRPQSRRIFFADDELRRRHFLSYKFTIYHLHVDFITKWGSSNVLKN